MSTRVLPLLSLVAILGCSPPLDVGQADEAETAQNGVSLNGDSLNGVSLNGVSLNGVSVNGVSVNGVSVNGVTVNGVTVNGVTVNGHNLGADEYLQQIDRAGATLADAPLLPLFTDGGLRATTRDGTLLANAGLIGALLVGETNHGREVALRIDDAVTDDQPSNDDITLFSVSWHSDQGWIPLCLDDAGHSVSAVAVPGRWNLGVGKNGGAHVDDADVLTFGCIDAAVGKCARLGYKSWHSELAPYHQACTRLIRADYCGDGRSHTIDGTEIDLWDRLAIQTDTQPDWYFEAEWRPEGARCVKHQRIVDMTVVPGCLRQEIDPSCGDPAHFDDGTLLVDRYEVAPTRR